MATVTSPTIETLHSVADLIDRLGGVSPDRIRLHPAPGTATEDDLIFTNDRKEGGLCELVEGVLVEKAMGFFESRLAAVLLKYLGVYLDQHKIGFVLGPDGMIRFAPTRVRLPDISFISRDQVPTGKVPHVSIADLIPELAVEILSPGNTRGEMERKRAEYFEAGTELVWIVDPEKRTVQVFDSVEVFTEYDENATLTGGQVLPGFSMSIAEWFHEAETV